MREKRELNFSKREQTVLGNVIFSIITFTEGSQSQAIGKTNNIKL